MADEKLSLFNWIDYGKADEIVPQWAIITFVMLVFSVAIAAFIFIFAVIVTTLFSYPWFFLTILTFGFLIFVGVAVVKTLNGYRKYRKQE